MASSIQHLAPLALCLLLLLTPNLVLAGKGGAANKGGGAKKGGGGGRGHKGGAGGHKVGGAAGGHKGGKGAAPKGGGGVGPAKPAGPGPAKPAGPGPAKPVGPGPAKPAGPGLAKPVGPGPAKPAGPGPAKPGGPGPAKPVGPGLAKPAGPGPVIPPGNPTGGDGGPGNGAGITYHGGPLLIGDINLSIIFYGQFMADQKNVVRGFLRSLENTENDHIAAVHRWWDIVESYQLFTGGNNGAGTPPRLRLKVGTQQSDDKYTLGKVLTIDFIKSLVQKANSGKPNTLHVIFTGSQVTVHNLCRGKCSEHGVIDDKLPYLIVGNPEIECPGACAWPFQRGDYGTPGQVTVKPPNGNIGIDAMLVNFASGLANAVTNPFNTGFFKPGPKGDPVEAGSACENIFGSGATPGQTGKTDVDPATGAAFNAVGEKGMKFMIPAVWNPRTSSCWTAM